MNTSKRHFTQTTSLLLAQRAIPGMLLAAPQWTLYSGAATLILLPMRANAIAFAPLALGFLIAEALAAMFGNRGLTSTMLDKVRGAAPKRSKEDASFHGSFSDEVDLNTDQKWRFQNGQLVGVKGNSFAQLQSQPRQASDLNLNELRALSMPYTMSNHGVLVPVSPREAPSRLVRDAYRELVAQSRHQKVGKTEIPEYKREFRDFDTGKEEIYGVYGRTASGALQVAMLDTKKML